jgi:RNA polymerase sigma factor (sigma-70 family)
MDLSFNVYSKCDRCREGRIEEPEILCYYHQKIQDGLIDEPESEVGYAEVWCEDIELFQIFTEQLKFWANVLCKGRDREDARQYASMMYRKTITSWNPSSASWVTFCSNVIRNSITDFNRKKVLNDGRTEFGVVDADWKIADQLTPEELVMEKERVDILRQSIADSMIDLTERQTDVLWQRMVTYRPATQQELADKWKCDQSTILREEERIIKKLREEMSYEI